MTLGALWPRRSCGTDWAAGWPLGPTPHRRRPIRTGLIKIIVPFVPGSPVDAAARVITQHIQARLGQNIVIENKSGRRHDDRSEGGDGRCAGWLHAALHRPEPRLHPVLLPNSTSTRSRASRRSRPRSPGRMSWRSRRPCRPGPIAELVAHAKANPGKLAFGYGLATTPHILGETFRQVAGSTSPAFPIAAASRREPICSAAGSISTSRRPPTCCR